MIDSISHTMSESSARSPVPGWVVAAVVGLILLTHAAGRVGGYCSPLGDDDSYIFASFGCRMAHGDVLYRDMSDIKPPGLFMIYAGVYLVAPDARLSIFPIESIFLLAGYWVCYRFGRAVGGQAAGLIVAVTASLAINYFTVTGLAIVGFGLAENFLVLPFAVAAFCYHRSLANHRTKSFIAVGIAMGVATCIKQTAMPLVVAVAVHWTFVSLFAKRDARAWLFGMTMMFLGGLVGWAPAFVMFIVQGTLSAAWILLTSDAREMLARASAWPADWRYVLPLCVPFVWMAWAVFRCIELRIRGRRGNFSIVNPLGFLVLWAALEMLLIAHLPLRSSHYYVSSCIPFVLLTAYPVLAFSTCMTALPGRDRAVAWCAAIVLSAVFARASLDEIVPRGMAAWRSYDWLAERARFDDALKWGPIHFGRGEPFLEPSATP